MVSFKNGAFGLHEEDLPLKLEKGKILIKVAFSTCNPTDRYTFQLAKAEGTRLGADGSGTVVKLGEGVDPSLMGRKVAFLGGGWSKYKVEDASSVLILDDSQDLAKAGMAWVNPYTAIG